MTDNDMNGIGAVMLRAAALRVQGKSWAEVAEEVGRAPITCRNWRYKKAEEWNKALTTAIDNALGTFEHEALSALRAEIRKKDGDITSAAKALLQHARELRGTKQEITHKTDASGVTFQVVYPDEENDSDD